jgi:hypothetical protein
MEVGQGYASIGTFPQAETVPPCGPPPLLLHQYYYTKAQAHLSSFPSL